MLPSRSALNIAAVASDGPWPLRLRSSHRSGSLFFASCFIWRGMTNMLRDTVTMTYQILCLLKVGYVIVRPLLEFVPPMGRDKLEDVARGGHEHRLRLRLRHLLHARHPHLLPGAVLPPRLLRRVQRARSGKTASSPCTRLALRRDPGLFFLLPHPILLCQYRPARPRSTRSRDLSPSSFMSLRRGTCAVWTTTNAPYGIG